MSHILDEVSGRVLLVGGYGVGNIGDEAILSGLLDQVSPNISELTVVTHDAEETRSLHASSVPSSVSFSPIEPSPRRLTAELIKNDHFVFGGGGLFSRYMGPYAAKIPYYAIAAKSLFKSVHWEALGVYPSTPRNTLKALSFVMNRSSTVSVRDPVSQRFLSSEGVRDVALVDDAATKLSFDSDRGEKLLEEQGVNTNEPVIGVAARRVLNDSINDQLQTSYLQVSKELNKRGYNIVFIPFCRHSYAPIGKDHEVCETLESKVDQSTTVSYSHPTDALSIVSAFDGLLATRLHSMIFAHICETPFVAIEYADKVSSLLKYYGKEDHGIDLTEARTGKILSKMDELVL
ncbi:polysaccharide pyruvyl transferase family protein [Haloferax larsenii]|uniref:Polysaccharide pyruvyl transferase family protein n=1 Tax=Haloferax larsenii TaxID=302484 RepID=A0ABY5RFD0_HALLR|nr:polysaccharide pyruvyl transferase family protein [Haloferax larsenii]UVE50740.1 polysaccharide pyruvyl transferase family protein [Haloferax larsenii]